MTTWVKDVIYEPADQGLDIPYNEDDFIFFDDKVCSVLQLTTLSRVIHEVEYSPGRVREYICNTSHGIPSRIGDIRTESVSDGQIKFHAQLFHVMWEIPLEEVPLYVNDDPVVIPVVKWRLEIAK
jgi:hypothetical protein